MYSYRPPLDDAGRYVYLKKYINIALQVGEMSKVNWAFNTMTGIKKNYKNAPHAIEAYKSLLTLFRRQKPFWTTQAYIGLGQSYYAANDYGAAIQNYLIAEQRIHDKIDSALLYDCYNGMWAAYSHMGESKLAYEHGQKAYKFSLTSIRAKQMYWDLRYLVGWALNFKDGKKALAILNNTFEKVPPATDLDWHLYYEAAGTCYAAIGDYDKADKFFKKMSDKAAVLENLEEVRPWFEWALGNYYLKRKMYDRARSHLKNSFDSQYKDLSEVRDLGLIYALYQVDSATGQNASALKYLRQYVLAKDAANTAIKNIQISELQIAYQTEQRKKDISILQEKGKVQRIGLERANLTRNWILGGCGMLILLLGVSYNGYRLKKRSNRELEMQRAKIAQNNADLNGLLTQQAHLIQEKEWLLKELHHRVKNNLHMVICLLESQALYLQDDALKAIEVSQHRIHAMSLIHQKLYLSDDVKHIDMANYLPEFVRYLSDSFGTGSRIAFRLEVAPLKLGVAQAIPLALIVNEVITNAIKHAFPANRSGAVIIKLTNDQQQVTLQISDDGVGINPQFEGISQDTLGMTLIRGLSEDLNGTLSVQNRAGTVIIVVFSLTPVLEELQTSDFQLRENVT